MTLATAEYLSTLNMRYGTGLQWIPRHLKVLSVKLIQKWPTASSAGRAFMYDYQVWYYDRTYDRRTLAIEPEKMPKADQYFSRPQKPEITPGSFWSDLPPDPGPSPKVKGFTF